MKAGELHTIEVTTEQLGYLDMCVRQTLKKDRKGAKKFGADLCQTSSLAHRLRVGGDVEDIVLEARDVANGEG